jgi:hypothetical protein
MILKNLTGTLSLLSNWSYVISHPLSKYTQKTNSPKSTRHTGDFFNVSPGPKVGFFRLKITALEVLLVDFFLVNE